jgi:hypothetical protein
MCQGQVRVPRPIIPQNVSNYTQLSPAQANFLKLHAKQPERMPNCADQLKSISALPFNTLYTAQLMRHKIKLDTKCTLVVKSEA